jgi:NADH-quinone oxidoreductase subunit A
MVFNWFHLALIVLLLAGVLFAIGALLVPFFLAPKARGGAMAMPYECGMRPQGSAWGSFNINYYFYALIFLAFDVDVLYLFPVAVIYPKTVGWFPFAEIVIFLSVLGAAILYFYKKGVFTWPRKINV